MLVGTALVQGAWLSRVTILGARLDLIWMLVLVWAAIRGRNEALVWCVIGGFVLDLLSAGGLGVYILALLAVAYLGGQPWGQALGLPALRLFLLAVTAGLAYHLVLLLALASTGRPIDWPYAVLRVAFPSVALNATLSPLMWLLLSWVDRRLRRGGLGG